MKRKSIGSISKYVTWRKKLTEGVLEENDIFLFCLFRLALCRTSSSFVAHITFSHVVNEVKQHLGYDFLIREKCSTLVLLTNNKDKLFINSNQNGDDCSTKINHCRRETLVFLLFFFYYRFFVEKSKKIELVSN